MEIRGKYSSDGNFINVYVNNCIYTISKKTGEWGYLNVGKRSATGHTLTQERYNELESACLFIGRFQLKEH